MLLTIDLGNTSLKLGVFHEEKLISFAAFDSKQDDYSNLIRNFLYRNGLKESLLDDVIISCVVPNLNPILSEVVESLIEKQPIFINPLNNYGIKIDTPNVEEVGSDIVVMCSYAYHLFKQELLIVSMGTASVISHVTKEGSFKHCIIFPGFGKVAQTLWGNAAKLPKIDIVKTNSFLANTTVDAMNVGIFQGYIGQIRYLLAGLRGELMSNPRVIACGGFGKDIIENISEISFFEPDLVTLGLNHIYRKYINHETNIG